MFYAEKLARGETASSPSDSGGTLGANLWRKRLTAGLGWLAALACALPACLWGLRFPAAELGTLAIFDGAIPMVGLRFFYEFCGPNKSSRAGGAATFWFAVALPIWPYAKRYAGWPGGFSYRHTQDGEAYGYCAAQFAVIAVGGSIDSEGPAFRRMRFDVSCGRNLFWALSDRGFLLDVHDYRADVSPIVVRLLAVKHSKPPKRAVPTAFPASMDDAAANLARGLSGCRRVAIIPLLRRGMSDAAIFVFADVMKELARPRSFVRPFNFDHTWQFASSVWPATDGSREASTAALLIVRVGIFCRV